MNSTIFWGIFGSVLLLWLSIYLASRNIRSKIAWITFGFLFSLSVYFVASTISRQLTNYDYYRLLWRCTEWSWIIPIPLLFHFSTVVSKRDKITFNRILLFLFYGIALFLAINTTFNGLVIDYGSITAYRPESGFFNPRGPLFNYIGAFIVIVMISSIINYLLAWKNAPDHNNKIKNLLAFLTVFIYLFTGPFVVYLFDQPIHTAAIVWSPLLLVAPFLPMIIAIIKYRLISDVDSIFDINEFTYLSLALLVPVGISLVILHPVVSKMSDLGLIIYVLIIYLVTFTYGFQDWFTTFLRDLLFNTGRGFSIISDNDTVDLIRNYHVPEKLETNLFLRFNVVRGRSENKKIIDSAQTIIREAVEYFKQDDYPRRTKQNLKYQILKMMIFDEADEGQILWELGFEGYPMKIMSGEDQTRKPLFKIESMSDYTAVSRNAFISLKKEAIHDLTWRLSYLEKTSK